jgi:hypothetical protein
MTQKSKIFRVPRSNRAMVLEVGRRTFDWFRAQTNAKTGLILDRNENKGVPATIAGTGFGIICYCIAADFGWITRKEARDYVLKILQTLSNLPEGANAQGKSREHGFLYHMLVPDTGLRATSANGFWNSELSSIDTALLMIGALFARNYFDQNSEEERAIQALSTSLYESVEWTWMLLEDGGISMAWSPENGLSKSEYRGDCEDLQLYVQALGSSNHPIPADCWQKAVTSRFAIRQYRGKGPVFVQGPGMPAFFEQFNDLVPFSGVRDAICEQLGRDYHENGVLCTQAQIAYARLNPGGWTGMGKSSPLYGLNASDGPNDEVTIGGRKIKRRAYSERGIGEAFDNGVTQFGAGYDDGVIAFYAAFGSMHFLPGPALRMMRYVLKRYPEVFDEFGFADSFSLQGGLWVDRDSQGRLEHLSIDQGPLLISIYKLLFPGRYERIMRKDPAIRLGLTRAGFKGPWLNLEAPKALAART